MKKHNQGEEYEQWFDELGRCLGRCISRLYKQANTQFKNAEFNCQLLLPSHCATWLVLTASKLLVILEPDSHEL